MNSAFSNPEQQLTTMKNRIQQELNKEVSEELQTYAEVKSNEKYDQIFDTLVRRVNEVDAIYETENKSKEQYFERMQLFLQLTNPADIADELKNTLVFKEIESEYLSILSHFSKDKMFGKLFLRYQFDKKAFLALEAGLLSDIKDINSALEDFAYSVSSHLKTMKAVKSSKGGKMAFKIGTKIAGSLLLGPLGSIAGGALANALTNDDGVISQSYGKVIDAWTAYLNSLDSFLINLRTRYEHILLTIVGGLFVRVNQDLKTMEVQIANLFLGEYGIDYEMTAITKKQYKMWMDKTIVGILTKIKEEKFEFALKAANELYHYINTKKLLKYEQYNNDQSFLYTACLYKFAAISTFAFNVKDDTERFSFMVYQLFDNQPLLLKEADLKALHVPTQFDLVSKAVFLWLDAGTFDKRAAVLPRFLLKILNRYDESGVLLGEPTTEDAFSDFGVIIGKLLHLEFKQTKFKYFTDKVFIPVPRLKALIKQYQDITGADKKEMIADFMRGMIFSARFWKTLRFMRKPIFYVSVVVIILGSTLWFTKDSWTDIFVHNHHDVQKTMVKETISMVTIKPKAANVRSNASLKGKIVKTVSKGQQFQVVSKKKDSDGRLWLKIKITAKTEGWISSKIVDLKKVEKK